MGILGNLGRRGPAPSQLIMDRCWADPGLDQLCDQVRGQGPLVRLDLVMAYLRPLRSRPDQHTQVGDTIDLSSAVDLIRSRVADPRTPRDDRVDLLALLGQALVQVAWQVRGDGAASSVPAAAWPKFRQILQEADDVLIAALQMYPQHPGAATTRLITARGLRISGDEWWTRFEAACGAQPTLYLAHTLMLIALSPKWFGSDEVMFGFAHQIAAQAPPGDPVVAMLPLAHSEYICAVQMGRSTDGPAPEQARLDDEEAVMAASWKWAGDGSQPAPAHPYALEAHNLFGWFLGNSNRFRERGRWHLEQARHRGSNQPWCWLSDQPAEAFADLHARLGLT